MTVPDPSVCEKCGQVHDPMKCRAHNRRGGPCNHWPAHGQRVCWLHGARSPQAISAALVRAGMAEARREADTYGLPRDIGPHEALLEEIARTAGHIDWLGSLIRGLAPQALTRGEDRRAEAKVGMEAGGRVRWESLTVGESAQVNAWLRLYQDERAHLVRVCTSAVRCGVEQRRVELAEQTGALIAEVFRAVFDDPELGLVGERRAVADRVVARHLRSVA